MEKTFFPVKVVLEDVQERFVENESFNSCRVKYNSNEGVFDIRIPVKREAPKTSEETITQVQKHCLNMRFVKQCRGYAFKMDLKTDMLLNMGRDKVIQEFENALTQFITYLEKLES